MKIWESIKVKAARVDEITQGECMEGKKRELGEDTANLFKNKCLRARLRKGAGDRILGRAV